MDGGGRSRQCGGGKLGDDRSLGADRGDDVGEGADNGGRLVRATREDQLLLVGEEDKGVKMRRT